MRLDWGTLARAKARRKFHHRWIYLLPTPDKQACRSSVVVCEPDSHASFVLTKQKYTLSKVIVRCASGFNSEVHQRKEKTGTPCGCLLFFGGTDGNWTRVQRPVDTTFSVGSRSFKIPLSVSRATGLRSGSPFMHDRYKGELSVHVHY